MTTCTEYLREYSQANQPTTLTRVVVNYGWHSHMETAQYAVADAVATGYPGIDANFDDALLRAEIVTVHSDDPLHQKAFDQLNTVITRQKTARIAEIITVRITTQLDNAPSADIFQLVPQGGIQPAA